MPRQLRTSGTVGKVPMDGGASRLPGDQKLPGNKKQLGKSVGKGVRSMRGGRRY